MPPAFDDVAPEASLLVVEAAAASAPALLAIALDCVTNAVLLLDVVGSARVVVTWLVIGCLEVEDVWGTSSGVCTRV